MGYRIPVSAGRPLMQRNPRARNERHLKWIRTLPCLICAATHSTEAAHIRYADAASAKRSCGFGEKPDDRWTVPLCNHHHREQHATGNERTFWQAHGINPLLIATALHGSSGDNAAAIVIMGSHTP